MSAESRAAAQPATEASGAADRPATGLCVLLVVLAAASVAIEACLVLPGHLLAAQIAYAVLVLMLVNIGPRDADLRADRAGAAQSALRALALVPLIRVCALGLPARGWSEAGTLLLIAVLIGAAALRMAPMVGVPRRSLLRLRLSAPHALAIAAGLLLGGLAYLAGAPALWPQGAASRDIALACAAATCAAIAEEIVFRGVVQVTFARALGALGVIVASALFAATYLDAGTTAVVLSYALAGFVFARSVSRTATLGGAIIGHVLLALGAGAAWPVIFGRVPPVDLPEPLTSVLLTIAIAVAASAAHDAPQRQP
jgi:membrane protease YdiL (CAAX protease family)